MGISKGQIALLHVARAKMGIDEDTYRAMLEAHAGVRSAKDLDYRGFKRVMECLERAGFKSKRQTEDRGLPAERPGRATEAQLRKIYASWWALGGAYYRPGQERKALRGFLKKRFRVEHENFLTFAAAYQVIEAIKKIGERV